MKKFVLSLVLCLCVTPFIFADTVSTDSSGFQKISSRIPDAVYDMRYYSDYNFTGHRIEGYHAPVAYMTKEALDALVVAADDLRKQGYDIETRDCMTINCYGTKQYAMYVYHGRTENE